MQKRYLFLMMLALTTLSACQSLPKATTPTTASSIQPKFAISGKIGITTVTDEGKQAGSAFYAWGQEAGRFSIDLTGVLGLGATYVRYDGKVATMTSEQGTITAATPEDLLIQTTGWYAPISQLPYWIIGQVAPSDDHSQKNQYHQLIQSQNGAWQAHFDYHHAQSTTPYRLRIHHKLGHRVVMTINHQHSIKP